jgi:hypothetical protein
MVTVFLSVIMGGAALGISRGLASGLEHRIHRWLVASSKSSGAQRQHCRSSAAGEGAAVAGALPPRRGGACPVGRPLRADIDGYAATPSLAVGECAAPAGRVAIRTHPPAGWSSTLRCMALDGRSAIAELDSLLEKIEPRIELAHGMYWFTGTGPERTYMRTRCIAAVERLAPRGSRYVLDATSPKIFAADAGAAVAQLAGIVRALRDDYEAGYMRTVAELIHADVFADFLEMADELLGKNYKDAAAVIAGSVLEEHLRKLAAVHGVAVESAGRARKADTINADLVKAEAYNKLVQKQVTASLGLRNEAAHGHYDNYDAAQVDRLVREVRDFMVRYPA